MFLRILNRVRKFQPFFTPKIQQQSRSLYNWQHLNNAKISSPLSKYVGICAATAGTIGFAKVCQQKYNLEIDFKSPLNPLLETKCEGGCQPSCISLDEAVCQSKDLINQLRAQHQIPGLVIAVSIDGNLVWEDGFGYSDVENRVCMCPNTVMRVNSISNALTMAVIARIYEAGKLDLDRDVQCYVPCFPPKNVQCENVRITSRQLANHTSGIRNYDNRCPLPSPPPSPGCGSTLQGSSGDSSPQSSTGGSLSSSFQNPPVPDDYAPPSPSLLPAPPAKWTENKSDAPCCPAPPVCSPCPPAPCCMAGKGAEFYTQRRCSTVTEALQTFKDDPLFFKPGCKFFHSAYGYVLLSAVAEGAVKAPFPCLVKQMFKMIGMCHSYLDEQDAIIPNRSQFYIIQNCQLNNVPHVDNSCLWAARGFLSTAGDLVRFGNTMLYSYQFRQTCPPPTSPKCPPQKAICSPTPNPCQPCPDPVDCANLATCAKSTPPPAPAPAPLPGVFKQDTAKLMWAPCVDVLDCDGRPTGDKYGLGWTVTPECTTAEERTQQYFSAFNSDGVGASSVLLVLPKDDKNALNVLNPPKGVVVTIMTNLSDVQLKQTALCVAKKFEKVDQIPEKFVQKKH